MSESQNFKAVKIQELKDLQNTIIYLWDLYLKKVNELENLIKKEEKK